MSLCYSALTIPWGKHNNMYKLSSRTEWFCQSWRAFKSLQFSVKTELWGGRKTAQRWDRDPHYYCTGGCFVYVLGCPLFVIVFLLGCLFPPDYADAAASINWHSGFNIGLTVKREKNYEKSALFYTRGLQQGVRGSRGSSNDCLDWFHNFRYVLHH